MVGQYIKNSELINQEIKAYYVNLSTSTSVDEIGKAGIVKWIRYIKILTTTIQKGLFQRPDLVYITLNSRGLGLFKDSFIVLICRLLRIPHVYHFHNKGVKLYANTRLGKIIYPFVFTKAEVILLSPLLYPDIEDYVPQSRVHYCANGIPDLNFPLKQYSNKTDRVLKLLFLSNLIKSKGILDLIEACLLLKKDGISFRCTIAGGEGDISAVELQNHILKAKLSQQIHYVGKIHGDAKREILIDADVFIHPTHNDCFPLVLLEAMQAGLPIIATMEGAIPEIVEDGLNGYLVPAQNPQILARKIGEAYGNPDQLKQMGISGKQKFDAQFSLIKFEERFLNILKDINKGL